MLSRFRQTVENEKPSSVERCPEGKAGALLATYKNGVRAIVKPVRSAFPSGHERQANMPASSLPDAEVAYWQLSRLFGWSDMVPETVWIRQGKLHGSAQQFHPTATKLYAMDKQLRQAKAGTDAWRRALVDTSMQIPQHDWLRLLVLDLLAAHRDRHVHNVGVRFDVVQNEVQHRLVVWDNSPAFGAAFGRYHSVFHKVLFYNEVPEAVGEHIALVANTPFDEYEDALRERLTGMQVQHTFQRAQWLRERAYKLSWRRMSANAGDSKDFPAYEGFFRPITESPVVTAGGRGVSGGIH